MPYLCILQDLRHVAVEELQELCDDSRLVMLDALHSRHHSSLAADKNVIRQSLRR